MTVNKKGREREQKGERERAKEMTQSWKLSRAHGEVEKESGHVCVS